MNRFAHKKCGICGIPWEQHGKHRQSIGCVGKRPEEYQPDENTQKAVEVNSRPQVLGTVIVVDGRG